jgi:hypothetical protein
MDQDFQKKGTVRLIFVGLVCLATLNCGGSPANGRWIIVSDSRGGVWRMDSKSGAMDRCGFSPNFPPDGQTGEVRCTVASPALNPSGNNP